MRAGLPSPLGQGASSFFSTLLMMTVALAAEGAAQTGELSELALARLEEHRAKIVAIADRLWEAPELAHREHGTARLLAVELRAAGFRVQEEAGGLPTAFRASYGEGRPVIGIVALLDALPGLSQRAGVLAREPLGPGDPGHGCGHHLIGAADLGAVLALASALESSRTAGTVVLIGAPAEEIYHGGVYLVREGVFDDLDALLFWHPSSITAAISRSGLAMESVRFAFTGRPSDATDAAAKGRNALRAAEVLVRREGEERHRWPEPSVVNHVLQVPDGIPSVVPESAAAWYFVHGRDLDAVREIRERLAELARRAAAETGTRLETQILSRTRRWLIHRGLVELIEAKLEEEPMLAPGERDLRLAAGLRADFGGLEEPAFSTGTRELGFSEEPVPISDDTAEASWVTPRGGFLVACFPAGTPSHSWQWTAAGKTGFAKEGMMRAARVLVRTASELFEDGDLLRRVRAEFERATAGEPYRSPLPEDQGPFEFLPRSPAPR